nr:hypothetical protein [Acidobacteriota bacterium]
MARRPASSPPPLGEFELVVMLALLQLKDGAYPVAIRDAIHERTGREVSRPAVFITLERLEDKDLVSSRYGDPTPVRGGRAKREPGLSPARQRDTPLH